MEFKNYYMIEIIYEDVIIVIKINKKIIFLLLDKEINKCLNFML